MRVQWRQKYRANGHRNVFNVKTNFQPPAVTLGLAGARKLAAEDSHGHSSSRGKATEGAVDRPRAQRYRATLPLPPLPAARFRDSSSPSGQVLELLSPRRTIHA